MKPRALFLSILALSGLAPVLALAQGTTINVNLPGAAPASGGVGAFVSNFYSFALLMSGILAFGAIVWGGVRYAAGRGNPSSESEGKSWITNALLGLLLLFGAYIILFTINPNILNLQLPALPNIAAPALGNGGTGGGTGGGGGGTGGGGTGTPGARCQAPASGPCSVANLTNSCFGAGNAALAGGVCNVESNGNAAAKSGTDKCDDGSPVSFGLFQVNISANNIGGLNCRSAFSNAFTGSNPHCTITNQALYQQCAAAAMDATTNINYACQISGNGANWSPWGPATKAACGL